MILSIHHVSLLVSSEESVDFFIRLGFSEIWRKQRKFDSVVLLDGFGMQLEIFVDGRHPAQPMDDDEPLGVRHFALKVDDIESTVIELKERDFSFTEIGTDWMGIKYCYLNGPDGMQVELHE